MIGALRKESGNGLLRRDSSTGAGVVRFEKPVPPTTNSVSWMPLGRKKTCGLDSSSTPSFSGVSLRRDF